MLKQSISVTVAIALFAAYGCTHQKEIEQKNVLGQQDASRVSSSQDKRTKQAELAQRIELQSVQKLHHIQSPTPLPFVSDPVYLPENRDNYANTPENGVRQVISAPLSTFSIDVDTGSYSNARSYLNMGEIPPADAIREEAFINYFPYEYKQPKNQSEPFSIQTEAATSPWNDNRTLLKIGLQGYDIPRSKRQPSNLVFLIDVSGSMNQPDKLPLLKRSLAMLTAELNEKDTISLVTYAGSTQVVLQATSGDNKKAILHALENLTASGGTNGEAGIDLAYQQARLGYKNKGINRILLATDGDFNIGISDIDQLKRRIRQQSEEGVSLTTLGFGRGNYNDALMEQLANTGDGNHAYIDTIHEAKKVLLRQMSGTLTTIASDVKVQIEFNPETVKEYRLIGYQNRLLNDEDFNNDKVDAGEIGAGHSVTALYELTLSGKKGQIDDLRYKDHINKSSNFADELAQVKIRYKLPGESKSKKITKNVLYTEIEPEFSKSGREFQFAVSVAAFAQKLKGGNYINDFSYQQIAAIARQNKGSDPYNYRGEFVSLVEIAQSL